MAQLFAFFVQKMKTVLETRELYYEVWSRI